MFKIVTLAVILFTFIILHSVCGGVVRRDTNDNDDVEVTTKKPKLLRVQLKKFDPVLETEGQNGREERRRRQIDSAEFDKLSVFEDESPEGVDGEILAVVKPSVIEDAKGFEGREEEERLSQQTMDPFYELLAEATDGGRSPTDDERQRFDVESTTTDQQKLVAFEELLVFGEK